jgi:hypothetical protein
MWRKYFRLVRLVPGKVVVPKFGIIDFRHDDLSVDLCKTLFEKDFEYLDITPLGEAEFYGIIPQSTLQAKPKKRRSVNTKKRKEI